MPHQSETGHHVEKNPSSVAQVEQCITRVWEHPLVTDDLRAFRQEARALVEENMQVHRVRPDQYAAIPAGSFLWAVEPGSDMDFHLIDYRPLDTFPLDPSHDTFMNAEVAPIGDISFVVVAPGRVKALYHERSASALLLTPDEYLCGNIAKARQSRLALLREITRKGDEDSYWDSSDSRVKKDYFERYYKDWSKYGEKRERRFAERLEARAQQAHNPQAWKEGFLRSLDLFELPPFEVYKDALEQTNGALRLNPRFTSMGIR